MTEKGSIVDIQTDYMMIRRRLSKCNDPVEEESAILELKKETGMSVSALRRCAADFKREKREREQEQVKKGTGKSTMRLIDGNEWMQGLLYTREGDIKDCPYNVVTILKNHSHWKGRIRANLLCGNTEIDGKPITDADIFGVVEWCGSALRMSIRSVSQVHEALNKVGSENAYNPIVSFLDELSQWDGTPRIDSLFADFLGSENSPYTAYVARVLLCGMVARAYEPGCIIRSVPILEGPEGIGKSRFVRDLGHPWSREVSTNVDSQVAVADTIRGVWLAELMEMDAVSKAGAQRIKAFITTRIDRYRPAYGRVTLDHPRLAVFVGTINPSDAASQFREEDENTRFLPVVVSEYNADGFLSVREQLFAEAQAYLADHPLDWWVMPENVKHQAAEARSDRTAQDPWIEKIEFFLTTPERNEVTIPEILDMLDIPPERWHRSITTRVGILLTRLGWRVRRSDCAGGKRIRVYFRLPELKKR